MKLKIARLLRSIANRIEASAPQTYVVRFVDRNQTAFIRRILIPARSADEAVKMTRRDYSVLYFEEIYPESDKES